MRIWDRLKFEKKNMLWGGKNKKEVFAKVKRKSKCLLVKGGNIRLYYILYE